MARGMGFEIGDGDTSVVAREGFGWFETEINRRILADAAPERFNAREGFGWFETVKNLNDGLGFHNFVSMPVRALGGLRRK